MRQRLVGLALAAGLAALAGCTESAVIEGNVVVGTGQEGLSVYAVLWSVTETVQNGEPHQDFTAIAMQSVGVATPEGGKFPYTFYGLEKGRYVVGAFADLHDDRNLTDDTRTIDVLTPIDIDPTDEAKAKVDRDVFLGVSAPDRGTVRGTVHASAAAAAAPIVVYALDKPLSNGNAQVVASTRVAAGTDVAFALFNVPVGQAWLVAEADVGSDEDSSNDLWAFAALNPFSAVAGKDTPGIDVWLDRQSPDLGSLSGKITLNAALPNLSVQLLVLEPDDSVSGPKDGGDLFALVNLDASNKVEIPFTIPSLKKGSVFLGALLETQEAGVARRAQRVLSASEQPVALHTDQADGQAVTFPLGVGRCSGTIKLHHAPDTLKAVAIFALVQGAGTPGAPAQPEVHDALAVKVNPANGEATASYQMFGLEDGKYDFAMIPDSNGDGSFDEEYQSNQTYNGNPVHVTVTGGGRVTSDFDVTLP